jgi:uncharacterized protein (TIGR03437 family)
LNGQNAPLVYVQSDQINLQAPVLPAMGQVSAVVIANPGTSNELRSDPFTVTAQQALAPALFTLDGKSVAATNAGGTALVADGPVPNAAPAKPGDIVVIYATGLGQTTPAFSPGDVANAAAPAANPVSLTIGGVAVPPSDVLYAGVTPQSICGLQQINVRLPATLPDGPAAVLLSTGGVQSPAGVTIPVKR